MQQAQSKSGGQDQESSCPEGPARCGPGGATASISERLEVLELKRQQILLAVGVLVLGIALVVIAVGVARLIVDPDAFPYTIAAGSGLLGAGAGLIWGPRERAGPGSEGG